jgi:hypothetical protein
MFCVTYVELNTNLLFRSACQIRRSAIRKLYDGIKLTQYRVAVVNHGVFSAVGQEVLIWED